MLLVSIALAAAPLEPIPGRAVLGVVSGHWVSQGRETEITLTNLGASPLRLGMEPAAHLTVVSGEPVVPAGGKTTLRVTTDLPCKSDGWSGCGTLDLAFTGPGGRFQLVLELTDPNVGRIGSLPPRVYWDPTGKPPRSSVGGLGALGGLGGLGDPPEPPLPELPEVEPRLVTSASGSVRTSVSGPSGTAGANVEGLAKAWALAVTTCDTDAASPAIDDLTGFDGSVTWGADGRVMGATVERARAAFERCVVTRLFDTKLGAGPGKAYLYARPAPPPR